MIPSEIEICSICKRDIPPSEQAYVFEGGIVCAECNRKLRHRSIATSEERQEQYTTRSSNKRKLLLGAFCVLVFLSCVAVLLFFLDIHRSRTSESSTSEAKLTAWPFTTRIPEGFLFDRREEWDGRTFWVLKGDKFGQTYETLAIVKSTEENIVGDIWRASCWSVELCLGLSVGESALSQDFDPNKDFRAMLIPKEDDAQAIVYLIDEGESPAQSVFKSPIDPFPIPRLPVSKLLDKSLSEAKSVQPTFVSGAAGWCEHTLLVCAWAGNAYSYNRWSDRTHMLVDLCYSLSREPGWRQSPLDSVMPDGYKFEDELWRKDANLYVFRGGKSGLIEDTLIVVRWTGSGRLAWVTATEPLSALARCAYWAAELSVGKELSQRTTKYPVAWNCMTLVVKNNEGQYTLSDKLQRILQAREDDKALSVTFTLGALLAIGEQFKNIPALSFEDVSKVAGREPTRICTVSRAAQLQDEHGFLVLAGATAATPDAFWRIVQTVDELLDAHEDDIQSKITRTDVQYQKFLEPGDN